MPVGGVQSYGTFHATQLAGAVTSAIPATSYAFSANNYNLFGIDATYSGYGGSQISIFPIIRYSSESSYYACETFTGNVPSQSISCSFAVDATIAPGLYTLELISTVPGYYYPVYTNVAEDATFSIVSPPTATVTPTVTVTATLTSGATDTTATTNTVPSSVVTVTTYQTTVISVQTSTTILTGPRPVTVTRPCGTTKAVACNHDNCLRAYLSKTSSASAFCSAYTAGPPYRGNTPSAFATSCMSSSARLSSACTCLATAAAKPNFIRGRSGTYRDAKPAVEERSSVEISDDLLENRGLAKIFRGPDYTYGPGEYSDQTYTAPAVTTTVTAATVLSTTITDPPATVSTGTTTVTELDDSTVTVTLVTSTVDSRSASTVTVAPTACGSMSVA